MKSIRINYTIFFEKKQYLSVIFAEKSRRKIPKDRTDFFDFTHAETDYSRSIPTTGS